MSNLILLAGNHMESNYDWIKEVELAFSDIFENTYVQYYKHWSNNNSNIDLEYESKILFENCNQFHDYVIFAKSAGAVLAIKSIYENKLKPLACIFVGMPMGMIFRDELPYQTWLKNNNIKTLFIQKTNDPACEYQKLVKLIGGFSNKFEFREIDGDSHYYENIEGLKILADDFLLGIKKKTP